MTYQIISNESVEIRYTLFDYLDQPTTEVVDCRTIKGKRRYKEIFKRPFSNGRTVSKKRNKSFEEEFLDRLTLLKADVHFLSEDMNEKQRRLFAGFFFLFFSLVQFFLIFF